MGNKQGTVTYEDIDFVSLFDGLKTLTVKFGEGAILSDFGSTNHKDLVGWAVKDIDNAMTEPNEKEQARHISSAITHSRRGLSYFIEFLMRKEGFRFCKDYDSLNSIDLNNILYKRQIIDKLSEKVLTKMIDERNGLEHDFKSIDLMTASYIVEITRDIIELLEERTRYFISPLCFGNISSSWHSGPNGDTFEFFGWHGNAFLLNTIFKKPWLGIVVIDKTDNSKILIRRCYFNNVKCSQLIELWEYLTPKIDKNSYSGISDKAFKEILKLAGIAE